MFVYANPNPVARRVTDCSIRAVCLALGLDWDHAYLLIALQGMWMGDMMDVNDVWGSVLRQAGFQKVNLEEECPGCYTVADFCAENRGVAVLGTRRHVVTAIDGDWYDTWDSGDEPVKFYWYRKE